MFLYLYYYVTHNFELYTGGIACALCVLQVKSAEKFALQLCEHFLRKYRHVTRARVHIEEAPWKRMEIVSKDTLHVYLNGIHQGHVLE